MKIGGLQNLTLLDYPDKTACIVFTNGCNLRCPYCHNASLVTHTNEYPLVDKAQVFALLKKRKGILDGVVITGGEPLLQEGIEEFIDEVKKTGYDVKLDTNGTFPDKLERLIRLKKVDYVAMDIKNCPRLYALTAGVKNPDIKAVEKSAAVLLKGDVPYEFRTTVAKPFFDKSCFTEIGVWLKGAQKYYLQKFKDSGDLVGGADVSAYSDAEMQEFLNEIKKHIPSAELR